MRSLGGVNVAIGLVTVVFAFMCCPDRPRTGAVITPANAKTFYTRKRVNGRWITGRFAKHAAREKRLRTVAVLPGVTATATPVIPNGCKAAREAAEATAGTRKHDTSAVQAPPEVAAAPEDDRLAKLKEALQARASKLAEGGEQPMATGSIVMPKTLRSVTFDFVSGIRTTAFVDGTSLDERFDAALEQRVPPTRP